MPFRLTKYTIIVSKTSIFSLKFVKINYYKTVIFLIAKNETRTKKKFCQPNKVAEQTITTTKKIKSGEKMSLFLYIKVVFRQFKNSLWLLINCLKRLILFVFRRQNQQQLQLQQQHVQNNNSQYDPLDFVVVDKPLINDNATSISSSKTTSSSMMMANDSILNKSDHHHLHQQQQHSKFPNVQSYTEQGMKNLYFG